MIIFHIVTPLNAPPQPNRRLLIRFLCTSWTDYLHNEGASFNHWRLLQPILGAIRGHGGAVSILAAYCHFKSRPADRLNNSFKTSCLFLSYSKNSPRFTELRGSLPRSQQPTAFFPSVTPIQSKIPHSCYWNNYFNIILPFTPKSSTCLFPTDFPIKSLYTPLSFPLRATFSVILRFLRGFPQSFRRMSKGAINSATSTSTSCWIHY